MKKHACDVRGATNNIIGVSPIVRTVGTVTIEAAKGEGRRPTFEIVGYTGGVMRVAGFHTPVVVDLSGLKVDRGRIPILLDHDPTRIIGQTDRDGITIDASGVRLVGTVTGDDNDAGKVVTHARNGFDWQASIGVNVTRQEYLKPGERAVVNGRDVSGPLMIARESRLSETSFVAVGADSQTLVSVAASNPGGPVLEGDRSMNFDTWLEAKGFDPAALSDSQRAALEAAYDVERDVRPERVSASASVANTPAVESLEDVLARARKNDERVAAITKITAAAVSQRPGRLDDIERVSRLAVQAGSSPDEFELQLLRLMNTQPSQVYSRGSGNDGHMRGRVIEAAIAMSGNLDSSRLEKHFDDRTLEAADRLFPNGIGLKQVFRIAARENGHADADNMGVRDLLRAAFVPVYASAPSTLDLTMISTASANKFLAAGFNSVESGWREIAAIRPVTDFKTYTTYALTGGFEYDEVGPGGELKHATVGETTYTNRAKTYGRIFAVTYEDIRNDDLGALTQVPMKLGRGAALKLNTVFWTEFIDNASFFTSGNGNYIEGATPSTNDSRMNIEGLTRAETAFLNQTDPDGNPLGVVPSVLLVPNALNATANQLMNSTEVRDTTTSTNYGVANPHAGKYRVVRSSYLSNANFTGYSATAWYLVASPSELPVIEVAFLDGRDTPIVESADADFTNLGVQFRGVFYFGVAKQERRAALKSKGSA